MKEEIMLQINSKKKSVPVVEGQMTELGFNFEGRNCSQVKVTIECYVDAEQLNDFDGDTYEAVFRLRMPRYTSSFTKGDAENIWNNYK